MMKLIVIRHQVHRDWIQVPYLDDRERAVSLAINDRRTTLHRILLNPSPTSPGGLIHKPPL